MRALAPLPSAKQREIDAPRFVAGRLQQVDRDAVSAAGIEEAPATTQRQVVRSDPRRRAFLFQFEAADVLRRERRCFGEVVVVGAAGKIGNLVSDWIRNSA